MHSSEAAPAGGPGLLLQLGQLILRARADPQRQQPGTSHQVLIQTQPKVDDDDDRYEETFRNHINALWTDNVPICVEVNLAPSCPECYALGTDLRGLLLERWTMTTVLDKSESPAAISSPWLLNAVRSQLHFSQLAAWRARTQPHARHAHTRRRKLSRETNIKKMDPTTEESKLNVVYSVKTPAECTAAFAKPPADHTFPLTDIGSGKYLKVSLTSLPRLERIPRVRCACADPPAPAADVLARRLTDLTIGSRKFEGAINSNIGTPSRRLSIITNPGSTEYLFIDKDKVVDDRMHTPCSENGKHKCNCDDESDSKEKNQKLDEKRIKEIAKYKRRVRKEIRKFCDSTSSEGEVKKETTSIPILQAARFDRLRAIGCYRNQTYLTLPASRVDTKSPFADIDYTPPVLKTNTVSTQTDFVCRCGNPLEVKCDFCRMIRSEGSYQLSSLQENGVRRKLDDVVDKSLKKQKCDNNNSCSDIIKRPKLRRFYPKTDKLGKIVTDRIEKDLSQLTDEAKDPDKDRNSKKDKADRNSTEYNPDITDKNEYKRPDQTDKQTEFNEPKRQKTFSSSDDDYVLCDYGTIDKHEIDSPKDERADFKFSVPKNESTCEGNLESSKDGFVFPDPNNEVLDRFQWGFDSSMVFHAKTGLPLTSSPAPLRRGNSCFDFDDSINGISGIKSALSARSPAPPSPPAPRPRTKFSSRSGLLGSFEESLLQGRLPAVAEVRGFTAELGAAGAAFCAPHRRLPATVRFYGPAAPYTGHISLGPGGYRVARAGSVQLSLFNPHGTLVKMFVVLYDLTRMPPATRTFLRQRTLAPPPLASLRYLIHLRFMTSKSGKLYLHTDIRVIVSRKPELDTAAPRDERSPAEHQAHGQNTYELRSVTYSPDNPKYSPR